MTQGFLVPGHWFPYGEGFSPTCEKFRCSQSVGKGTETRNSPRTFYLCGRHSFPTLGEVRGRRVPHKWKGRLSDVSTGLTTEKVLGEELRG